ncbi:lactonase family protein [Paenibacillus flagellatus]|uniref:3-carboxymuconate cyclase n=1 Tax=Paenibacillus flagellatus TaxID=2211139 RepID=A0A2V5KPM2_9BACL|nr:lactonase family protein [Paenibacillus flagellatus]PYI53177.1 3-carboxymuconate cyclase [Paenibacillus flagellatus]
MTSNERKRLVFIGSYAEASNDGVYVYRMDEATGALSPLDRVGGLQNPTFLSLDVERKRLYAIAERLEDGQRMGAAVTFEIEPASGKLRELRRVGTTDTTTCHIQRDATDRWVVTASYGGGKVGLSAVGEDGTIGELLDMKQHEGHSVNPERQDRPHPHSAFFSPDNRFVFVPDLGMDRIRAYRIDEERGQLVHHGDTPVQPGAGPRHLAFHTSGTFVYVINELDSTVTSFRYDAAAGELHTLEVVSTLPEGFDGDNACAEIQVSPDGRFVYGSNRGHDSIVVYAVNPDTGKLTRVEHVSTRGGHPRHFSLSPEGDVLIAANRDSNNLVVFRVDPATGKLSYTGHTAEVSKPVCVKIAYFPV